jgi:hypothetical protein
MANSSVRPYLKKKPSQKRSGRVAQGEGLEYCKKKKKKKIEGG